MARPAACRVAAGGINDCNERWGLVDACREQKVKPEEIPAEQIQELGQKRDAYVAEELKKKAIDGSKSFDHGVRQAVRDQAKAKGIVIEAPKPAVTNGQ